MNMSFKLDVGNKEVEVVIEKREVFPPGFVVTVAGQDVASFQLQDSVNIRQLTTYTWDGVEEDYAHKTLTQLPIGTGEPASIQTILEDLSYMLDSASPHNGKDLTSLTTEQRLKIAYHMLNYYSWSDYNEYLLELVEKEIDEY